MEEDLEVRVLRPAVDRLGNWPLRLGSFLWEAGLTTPAPSTLRVVVWIRGNGSTKGLESNSNAILVLGILFLLLM